MVPGGGVEPPRAEAHESLSLARLPVPPARRVSLVTQPHPSVKAGPRSGHACEENLARIPGAPLRWREGDQ